MKSSPLLALYILIGVPLSAQTTSTVAKAAATITPADVARHVHALADDSMMGRATPSLGLEMTAQYVAQLFRQFELQPGAEGGGWVQRYPVLPDSMATAPNVVGMLMGADSVLKHEYLVFSAHIDHAGVKHGQADSIWNGADDNASGAAGLLELAEAFSQLSVLPRRSLLFVAFSGQSVGGRYAMAGSRFWLDHPPVPAGQIVANINLDMIGRNWRNKIVAVGQGHSEIGLILRQVAASHPELEMAVIPDSLWPRAGGGRLGIVGPFDHHTFLRFGIPGMSFFNDYHDDANRASDTPDLIDAEKTSRVVRLAFYLGHALAKQPTRPRLTGDGEQLQARLQQLWP